MKRHFEPIYRSDYGLSKAQWRRLSGIEKCKVIKEYRDKANLPVFTKFMETGDSELLGFLPFPPDREFVPWREYPDDTPF